ncbi:hypothetical protein M407DRAFT_28118 [Tulasnella calospora MUT 4182]|uniref:Uncharacterized protein n=1 Tax=Tulasnella calospora MUT 4182 TaxID=1051891 RepID=A0A0C3Q1Y3_9AGAM|nr:hypothetical protein M407DRAFT_28118 [Tulasnella calospora MUT 4182]
MFGVPFNRASTRFSYYVQRGKSTCLKQFQLLYAPASFAVERDSWKATIYLNLVKSIRKGLDAISHDDDTFSDDGADTGDTYAQLAAIKLRLSPLTLAEELLIKRLAGHGEEEATQFGSCKDSRPSESYGSRTQGDVWDHPWWSPFTTIPSFLSPAIPTSFVPPPSLSSPPCPLGVPLVSYPRGICRAAIVGEVSLPRTDIRTRIATYSRPSGGSKLGSPSDDVLHVEDKRSLCAELVELEEGSVFWWAWWSEGKENGSGAEGERKSVEKDDPFGIVNACRDDMVTLWKDQSVQGILRRKGIRLEEMPGFYLNDIHRVTTKTSSPSNQDVLNARLKTVGVVEDLFQLENGGEKGMDWRIFDVASYSLSKFMAVYKESTPNPLRELYPHLTKVTDTEATAALISDVREMILRKHLQDSSLIDETHGPSSTPASLRKPFLMMPGIKISLPPL